MSSKSLAICIIHGSTAVRSPVVVVSNPAMGRIVLLVFRYSLTFPYFSLARTWLFGE